MKKSIKKTFADFKFVKIKKAKQKQVKGGSGDSIIVEEQIIT